MNRPEQGEIPSNRETGDEKRGEYEGNEDGIGAHGEGGGYSTPKSAYIYHKLADINKKRKVMGNKSPRSDGTHIGTLMKVFSNEFDALPDAIKDDFVNNIYPTLKKTKIKKNNNLGFFQFVRSPRGVRVEQHQTSRPKLIYYTRWGLGLAWSLWRQIQLTLSSHSCLLVLLVEWK